MKDKGTCSNTIRITRRKLEERILATLREHLMTPEVFELFCEEYTSERNRLRREASAALAGKRAELKKVEAQIEKMIQAIMDGFYSPSMKDKMPLLEGRKSELLSELAQAEEPPALLHPAMAQEYKKRIDGPFKALEDEQTRLETSDDIRALIGRIVVASGGGEDGNAVLRLEGDLGGILTLAAGTRTPAHREDERVPISVVAGAEFEVRQAN